MKETVVDVGSILKVYGDRVLVRRLGEPEKKRGLYVPTAYLAGKKEPKKVWWGQVQAFGLDSKAQEDLGLHEGAIVGIEPMGNHYTGFTGEDGHTYEWVPDEHFCLADAGSVKAFYADQLDPKAEPKLRVLGDRLLLKPAPKKESAIVRPHANEEREAKISDVIGVGDVSEDLAISLGDRIVHVADDNGTSCRIPIFDPELTVLRAIDIVAKLEKEEEAVHA